MPCDNCDPGNVKLPCGISLNKIKEINIKLLHLLYLNLYSHIYSSAKDYKDEELKLCYICNQISVEFIMSVEGAFEVYTYHLLNALKKAKNELIRMGVDYFGIDNEL